MLSNDSAVAVATTARVIALSESGMPKGWRYVTMPLADVFRNSGMLISVAT
jgi:hypothetical protein